VTERGHTARQIKEFLAERNVRPNKALGQCFLIDLNLLDILVAEAELTSADLILEVGSGTGSLTQRLATAAGFVVSIEVDRGMYLIARDTVRSCPNVALLWGDALLSKHQLDPLLVAALQSAQRHGGYTVRKLVANLPYNIATPLLVNLLVRYGAWERFVVTLQRELAARLAARPKQSSYGALSVLVQALADVHILRRLPPSVFWPRPEVWSAIVKVRPRAEKYQMVGDVSWFHRVVHYLWSKRRKSIKTILRPVVEPYLACSDVDYWLQTLRIDGRSRPERLSVADFVRLAHELQRLLPDEAMPTLTEVELEEPEPSGHP
jgi:16S rRNA (adenine1518-N6/adenine1519-N6)-dimethyltransferase